MSVQDTGPLDWRIGIVDKQGRPTPEFQRRWNQQRVNNGLIGTIAFGSGAPPATPAPADGAEYVDTSTTPYTLYVGNSDTWHKSGVTKFTELSDVPLSYSGAGGKFVKVNAGATGLEFDTFNAVTSITAGTGLSGGTITSTGTIAIANTTVTPGSYTNTNLTVNAQGQITAASNGTAPPTGANPTATASDTAVNGSALTFMRSDASPAVQKATTGQFGLVKPDGSTITVTGGVISSVGGATGANPTATASDTAVNGSATTFMRSDAAPAIQKATSGQFGLVKVDGTTITASGGVISASGGGGSSVITAFARSNNGWGNSSSANASKGNYFTCWANCHITKVFATIDTATVSSFRCDVFDSGLATSVSTVVVSVVGTATLTGVTSSSVMTFDFSASPLALTAGRAYMVCITALGGSGTTVCNLFSCSSSSSPHYPELMSTYLATGVDSIKGGALVVVANNNPVVGTSYTPTQNEMYFINLQGTIP